MNILFVFDFDIIPTQGGVERVTYLLAEEMYIMGHSIDFLSVLSKIQDKRENRVNGFPFKQFHMPVETERREGFFIELLKVEKITHIIFQGHNNTVLSLLKYVPREIPRIVVYHYNPYTLYGFEKKVMSLTPKKGLALKQIIKRQLGIAFPKLLRYINYRRAKNRYCYILENCDKLVMLSGRFVKKLTDLTPGIDKRKLTSINNPNTFTTEGKAHYGKKENIVLFVGRLTNPQKNVTGFIDVWEEFFSGHPDWKAIVLGDGEHNEFILDYAARKKISNLSFLGNVVDVGEYYRKAKILCLTSTYEGWGMVLTEAMAYGCVPVVYDTYDSLHDIVDEGVNGMIASPFDVKDMVSKMSELAADEDKRLLFAREGEKKIERFSKDKIARQWEKLLLSLS